jgi:hypothetical protein
VCVNGYGMHVIELTNKTNKKENRFFKKVSNPALNSIDSVAPARTTVPFPPPVPPVPPPPVPPPPVPPVPEPPVPVPPVPEPPVPEPPAPGSSDVPPDPVVTLTTPSTIGPSDSSTHVANVWFAHDCGSNLHGCPPTVITCISPGALPKYCPRSVISVCALESTGDGDTLCTSGGGVRGE